MSQGSDRDSLVQARDVVQTALGELAQRAREGCEVIDFHRAMLDRVVGVLAAVGGAVWNVRAGNNIALSYQCQMQATGLADDQHADARHTRLLASIVANTEGDVAVIPPRSGSPEAGNATDCLLIIGRVVVDGNLLALIEVAQRGDSDPASQPGFVRFVQKITLLTGDFYRHRSRYELEERQALWTRLEEFTRTIHQSLDPRETAYTVVNEGRRLIECDRVSLALVRGTRCNIVAVSGQDQLDSRSSTVRKLGELATAVVRAGEPLWYRGDTSDLPPQVERAIEAYVDLSHTKMLAVFPLSASLVVPREDDATDEAAAKRQQHAASDKVYAALIVEQIEDSRLTESLRRRCEIVASHAASAVGNANEHNRIFLAPLWKAIGKSRVILAAEHLPKTLAVVAAIAAVVCVLLFLPWDFRVHATGRLEPVVRQRIFSPLDAEVRNVAIDHDSTVRRGELLAELYSVEIENTGKRLLGEGREIDERIAALTRQLTNESRQLQPHELTQLQGEWAVMQTRKKTNESQRELFAIQQELQQVRAPIDGVVVTWDVQNKLRSRPVMRSQFLMEIADPSGAWCLELSVPERFMGYIVDEMRKSPDVPLRVEFVPAADPNSRYTGTIERVADRAELQSGATPTNSVLIRVKLDDTDSLPTSIRPGAECAASITCGKAPLGFVLFSDLIAFVYRNIIFRFF
ncbi:MAG: efflux RND transporter periplasmic adaptor subunit [Thermoguttaceae bacterium]